MVSETNTVVSGGGAEGKESKKERKARKRMLKKQQEKEEGMDKLSKKQKSKIRSKAMVGTFYSNSYWWGMLTYYDKVKAGKSRTYF
jgi:hypothetical protein